MCSGSAFPWVCQDAAWGGLSNPKHGDLLLPKGLILILVESGPCLACCRMSHQGWGSPAPPPPLPSIPVVLTASCSSPSTLCLCAFLQQLESGAASTKNI